MPIEARAATRFSPTWRNWPTSSAPNHSLDAEEVGVQRLTTVMDLGAELGELVGEELGDATGRGGRGPVAFDDRHPFVLITDESLEQLTRGERDRVLDRHHALSAEANPVARVHLAGVGRRVANGTRDFGREDVRG